LPASYRDLGPTRLLTATPDSTFRNQGNWTIVADPQTLNCKVALAEVYQISIDGPIGSTMSVYRNTQAWNQVVQGWANNYDPTNPLYVRPGDSIFLFWKAPTVWLPVPTATLWLRYDTELPENRQLGG
jgi:hypothetical protein